MIEVAAGLICDGDLLLACQRSRSGEHALRWEFPGGKIEPGETAEACLRRELEEELGILAEIGDRLTISEHLYRDGPHVRVHFFAVIAYRGPLRNSVFERIVWQPRARLAELDFLDADRPLVEWLASQRSTVDG